MEGAERVNVVQYEGAPSFTDIINCACDTSDRSSKSYKRFAKDVKERLIECISFNECDRSQFTNTTGGKYGLCFAQAFQTVSDNFHVIPDVTHNVVVPYGQATELLDMLHRGELSEKISVLRRLQEYTVSLFDDDYRDLARKHAISLANEDFGVFTYGSRLA